MAYHDKPRYTDDIDLLIKPDDADAVREAIEAAGYFESAQPWTFGNTNITLRRFCRVFGSDFLLVDVLIGNDPRHWEIVDEADSTKIDGGHVRFARKEGLIWMKQFCNSNYDQADIKELRNDQGGNRLPQTLHTLRVPSRPAGVQAPGHDLRPCRRPHPVE